MVVEIIKENSNSKEISPVQSVKIHSDITRLSLQVAMKIKLWLTIKFYSTKLLRVVKNFLELLQMLKM